MAGEEVIVPVVLMVVAAILAFTVYSRRYKRVAPNEAMVVFGGKRAGTRGFRIITDGGKFIVPIIEQVRFLDLSVRLLQVRAHSVITHSGVPITVDCVVQFKITSERPGVELAAAYLLGKRPEEIEVIAENVVVGHVRGTCAKLEVEAINADRDDLGRSIREGAATDLAKTGIEVVSVTIRDIADEVGYLEALGKRRIAEVKRNAIIEEAAARRDAIAATAEHDKQGQFIKYATDQEIARAQLARDEAIAKMRREAEEREPGLKKGS